MHESTKQSTYQMLTQFIKKPHILENNTQEKSALLS